MYVFKNFVFNFLKDSFSKNDFEKYVPNIVFINSFFGFNILCLSSLSKIFLFGELIIDLTNTLDWVSSLSMISICSKDSFSISFSKSFSFMLLSLIINLETSPKISGGNKYSKFYFGLLQNYLCFQKQLYFFDLDCSHYYYYFLLNLN